MRIIKATLNIFYGALVRCYPWPVRMEFGEEMLFVFAEASERACRQGLKAICALMGRELLDWPGAVLRAYIETLKIQYQRSQRISGAGLLHVREPSESEFAMVPIDRLSNVDRRQAILMVLPLLLLSLGITASAMIRTDVWYRLPTWQLYLSFGVLLLPGVFVAAIGLMATLRRLPDWGLTWVGCAFMGFTLSFQVTISEFVEEGVLSIPPALELILGLTFFLAGLTLLLLVATRGWSRAGLFTMAVAGTMGLSLFQTLTAAPFNRDDIAVFSGLLGLVFASMMYIYIQSDGIVRWASLSGFALVNIAVVFISTNTLRPWLEDSGTANPILPLLVIITGLLLSGPISGVLIKPLLNRKA